MSDIDNIRSALSYIDPHDRDDWWHVGAAVKDELGENGFDLWDEWSQRGDSYSARDAKTTWKSLKPGMWHIETVWKMARQNGWKPDKPYTPPSAEEVAQRKAESEARRQAAEAERQRTWQKVKGTAQTVWKNSRPADLTHPYLLAKGITDAATVAGLRLNEYQGDINLVIPVLYGREIVNLQSINQDGGKRFLSGGQVEGGYAFIGKSEDVDNGVVLAEGYATAASIHQATGRPVIIAFNAGNMVTVAERLSQTLPEQVPVVIAVDNDASQTGIKKARQAAEFFNGRAVAVQPEFTMTQIQQFQKGKGVDEKGRPPLPSDFNDLHNLAGIEAVRAAFENRFRRPEPSPEPSQTAGNTESDIPSQQEQQMKTETRAATAAETNSIEFDGRTQETERSGRPEEHEQNQPQQKAAGETAKTTNTPKPDVQTAPMPSEQAKKAVLDLEYRIPDTLKTRYHAIGGKFYSAADGKTVLFEDKGRQLKTSLQDPQTVKDMLEVVKAKGWDNIKISGSKAFRQMMFIEAAAQGIKTSGYTPTQADLQQVEALRERYAKNGIEPVLTREQERQAETAKPEQEKTQAKPEQEQGERVHTEPDREMLAAAERLKAQSTMPSESQVNSSPRADTDNDVPIHSLGQEEVPAEVVHQTDNMKAAAMDTRFVSAKTVYTEKAQKLSKNEQKKLAFYERGVTDTLRGLEGDTRTDALRNYYEHTAKMMKGGKLDLPHPIQIPSHTQTPAGQKPALEQQPRHERSQEQEPEISR
ncbi:hypothetical protein BG910_04870 [Neisseria chenwenguii]|uniref:Toprim domain-containing protein n=1 Tax=Neisseria chenwenguii TaxID=1853278 RepID=A0A220S596_9NEIS|nr:LPD7 domain-containing protein [Neisseria chenwenguii]ASK28458.1 hypothetical protein BG910_04870 [Neisseria chenwenguii]